METEAAPHRPMKPYLREFDPARDYERVSAWWQAHGWSAVPVGALPRLGVVAYFAHEDDIAAAGWLYMDNSVGVCMLEWLVTRPANRPKDSLRALDAIIEFLQQRAVDFGYGVMLTTARQSALVRLHERHGFQKTDEGVTHLISFPTT
ncbi:MAG: hypothetical protein BGO12_05885 [Verrucomicrobia bacterium 61-8]|nr:hypothetical protein [Verrucomicrobiota bacterium]OJV02173.1 MAG: hypothetical protein BGO12_05885 [Verrucomicrobia bacterium 61-8]